MPIQIKDLGKSVRSVRVEFQGDSCMVQYRVGAHTPQATIATQERLDNGENPTEVQIERMLELIESWDLMDGDKPAALTREVMLSLPEPFLAAILYAVADDANPQTRKSRR